MEDQAFNLLRDELKNMRDDLKELRATVSKLYIKIAIIAGASGVAGGKIASVAPQAVSYLQEAVQLLIG